MNETRRHADWSGTMSDASPDAQLAELRRRVLVGPPRCVLDLGTAGPVFVSAAERSVR